MRAYAHLRPADAGELPRVHRRHLQGPLDDWPQADARSLGDPALQFAQQHEAATPDLRLALAWAFDAVCTDPPQLDAGSALSLVGARGLLWLRAGRAAEGLRWCERALALGAHGADGADGAARAGVDQMRAEPQAGRSTVLERLAALVQPDWSDLLRRFARSASACEARLHGRREPYRCFDAEELARCRALGALWEAWSADIGLMLAEHHAGHLATAVAVAVGREVLAEVRAAGRLRQNANRLAMWLMMLAESGETEGVRAGLAEASCILHGAGRSGMALLSAARLAHHEGRRSIGLLWARLRAGLGDAGLAEERAEAEMLSDGEALRLALAPQALGRRP